MMKNFFNKRKKWRTSIDPDEIFLDSQNIPGFDTQQFEGRIEKPIPKKTIAFVGFFFALIVITFVSKLWILQVKQGDAYFTESSENSLNAEPLFAERGIIYDRNHREIAWNAPNEKDTEFARRSYIDEPGFGHILGYVGYPSKDASGRFWQTEFRGIDGAEKAFNDTLGGINGRRLFETNVHGEVRSENTVVPPVHGQNLVLSIDAGVQSALARAIENLAESAGFKGGAGAIIDIHTGEMLALTSYPEFDPEVLSLGEDRETITRYLSDARTPFLNRIVAGLYAPGSIVKPFVGLAALDLGVIDADKKILSPGFISIPNPYNPDQPTIFREARGRVHGYVDMRQALAVSSNVYFMTIGGGSVDQKGIGIAGINEYASRFELGQKTGIELSGEREGTVPSIEWKKRIFPSDPTWRQGDTYNTSIGQYGFQVTPLSALRSIAALANDGTLLTPTILKDGGNTKGTSVGVISLDHLNIIKEGMRRAVVDGSAVALNIPGVSIAAKTGTAELGASKNYNNSWVAGFFPYEDPKYAFIVLMDSAPVSTISGATGAARELFLWMQEHTPEYISAEEVEG